MKMKFYIQLLLFLSITACQSDISLKLEETPVDDVAETETPVSETPAPVNNCPANYVPVPSSVASAVGLSELCVAKYEMKAALNDGTDVLDGNNNGVALDPSLHIAESRASGTPWGRISSANARSECQNLGDKYHLITLEQWNAIARNIESVGSNWTGGSVGKGMLFRGHSDNVIDTNAVADVLPLELLELWPLEQIVIPISEQVIIVWSLLDLVRSREEPIPCQMVRLFGIWPETLEIKLIRMG